MTNRIEELLKADEDALKAKRSRLTALTKAIKDARDALGEARTAAQSVMENDGLSRSGIKDAFGLSTAELALVLPGRPRRKRTSAGESVPNEAEAVQGAGKDPQNAGH